MRAALRSVLLRSRSAAAALPYTLNLDLTSSLDSRITFARAGTRNYINAGVLTSLATGTPAFESWDGVNRGLAIEPAFTNLITYSNSFNDASWAYTGASAAVAGDAGAGVMSQLSKVAATATANYHQIKKNSGSVTAGVTQTFQAFVKAASGATNYSCYLRMSNQFNNNGLRCNFRLDGTSGMLPIPDTSVLTGGQFWFRALSGGVYLIGITGTWVSTGNKEYVLGVSADTLPESRNYTAVVTDAVQVYGVSIANTSAPVGYVDTVAATASQAAETAIFNDTSWLTSTSQGTFLVEHDCWTGTIIGSGANTVLSATAPGKTAIAWSGVTSDTVSNGGSATSSVQPTFSGSDVRLLSTSGAGNAGHIKSIRFYPTRLSVAELQTLTTPTPASTATPGVLRGVSTKNRLPSIAYTTSGLLLNFACRFEMPIASSALSEIKLDFPNVYWPATAAGNAIIIDEVYLERVTGVAESVQVKVAGSGSFTVADGAATTVVSDAILPSAFTSLTEFPASMLFCVRIRGHVTTAGHKIVAGRSIYDTSAKGFRYDPAATTITNAISSTGALTYSGGSPLLDDLGYCPIMVGKFVSGDPKTCFTIGDSIVEGIVATTHQGPGLYIKKACMALGVPNIEFSKGGKSQRDAALATGWTPYLKYARVLIDEMGTNNLNAMLDFFTYWSIAKNTYGYDKIVKSGLTPVCTSSDSFATEANQTTTRAYPNNIDTQMVELARFGSVNTNHVPLAARGVNQSKWIVNGGAFYATADGTHPSVAADDLMKTEFQPVLAAMTVT